MMREKLMEQPGLDPESWPETIIQRELGPGESLVWAGKPRGGVRFSPADTAMLPFRIMWGGAALFAGYILIRAARTAASPFFAWFFAFLFLSFGFYTLVGRLLVEALRRRKTVYGLTSQRLIVASGIFRRSIRSFSLDRLPPLWLIERGDGSGTIGAGTPPRGFGPAAFQARLETQPPRLEYINSARGVLERIEHAQHAARDTVSHQE